MKREHCPFTWRNLTYFSMHFGAWFMDRPRTHYETILKLGADRGNPDRNYYFDRGIPLHGEFGAPRDSH